jgi:hypothetical protein
MRFLLATLLVVAAFAGGLEPAGGLAYAAGGETTAVVPEPATLLLYGMGLLVLARRLRVRR